MIERELKAYSEEISARPRLIALNKCDLVSPERSQEIGCTFENYTDYPVFYISGVTGEGLNELLDSVSRILEETTPKEEIPVVMPALQVQGEDFWEVVEDEEGGYRVQGKRLERMVAMTDLESRDAVRYLQRRLDKIGVFARLREAGIQEGDSVMIGELEFEYMDER